ncbi:hypothetical protein EUX98_g7579 [Antrodiella citrinella]|uniref:Uncharacterized protein n=1 Tax=Antrodiella citrinella TaxID=2447956 RepID=A0A4S4ML60_9APHY|nr:hypothetical protein EUX98_g7579 [Antrodiella citrinella]
MYTALAEADVLDSSIISIVCREELWVSVNDMPARSRLGGAVSAQHYGVILYVAEEFEQNAASSHFAGLVKDVWSSLAKQGRKVSKDPMNTTAEDSDVSKFVLQCSIERLTSLIKEHWASHEALAETVRQVASAPGLTSRESEWDSDTLADFGFQRTKLRGDWGEDEELTRTISNPTSRARQYATFRDLAHILSSIKTLLLQEDPSLPAVVSSFLRLYKNFDARKLMRFLAACLKEDTESESGHAEAQPIERCTLSEEEWYRYLHRLVLCAISRYTLDPKYEITPQEEAYLRELVFGVTNRCHEVENSDAPVHCECTMLLHLDSRFQHHSGKMDPYIATSHLPCFGCRLYFLSYDDLKFDPMPPVLNTVLRPPQQNDPLWEEECWEHALLWTMPQMNDSTECVVVAFREKWSRAWLFQIIWLLEATGRFKF